MNNCLILEHRKNCKGGILAEAAIVIPLIAALVFFVLEISSVLYLNNSLNLDGDF